MMSHQPAIDELASALAALSAFEDPLRPLFEALGSEQPLTFYALREHRQLLATCTKQADDQAGAIQRVIARCRQLPSTPLTNLPLGF
ncbi:MAG: hypothetical protein KDE28_16440 [Anaerolineales bacterium]|nr:hypothetical protein [Anaerolineales bacterium]